MCLAFQNRGSRAPRMVAHLSLVAGILLTLFVHPASAAGRDLNHFVSGLLLGLSITINLIALRRCCRPAASADSEAKSC